MNLCKRTPIDPFDMGLTNQWEEEFYSEDYEDDTLYNQYGYPVSVDGEILWCPCFDDDLCEQHSEEDHW